MIGKVDVLLPLIQLRHEEGFTWEAEQRKALKKIKEYLTSQPVLRAPKIGKAFKLYVTAQEHVVGATLMQDEDGKEHVVAYVT
jgi:hypothetical protein